MGIKLTPAQARKLGICKQPRRKGGARVIRTGKSVFEAACIAHGLLEPITEFRFDPARQWRFDYAWPEVKVALEVEGGVWTAGRHTRGSGFVGDMEKYNRAAVLGWRVLRCTPQEIEAGSVFAMLTEALV